MTRLKGITIRIDEEQRDILNRLKDLGVNNSFIIREAINQWIRKEENRRKYFSAIGDDASLSR